MEPFGFVELRGDPRIEGREVVLAGKVFEGRLILGDMFQWLVTSAGRCSLARFEVVGIQFYGQYVDEAGLGEAVELRLRQTPALQVDPDCSLLGCRIQ